jgi:hypothetical protein
MKGGLGGRVDGIWECGSMGKYGSVGVWECGSVEVWECGGVEVWECGR